MGARRLVPLLAALALGFALGWLVREVFVARKSLGVVKLSIVAGAIVPLSIPGR